MLSCQSPWRESIPNALTLETQTLMLCFHFMKFYMALSFNVGEGQTQRIYVSVQIIRIIFKCKLAFGFLKVRVR